MLYTYFSVKLRELKRQGLTNQDIASRMGRSVRSVTGRWSKIADEGEKRKQVRFSKAEDELVGFTCLTSIYLVTTHTSFFPSCCAWLRSVRAGRGAGSRAAFLAAARRASSTVCSSCNIRQAGALAHGLAASRCWSRATWLPEPSPR